MYFILYNVYKYIITYNTNVPILFYTMDTFLIENVSEV